MVDDLKILKDSTSEINELDFWDKNINHVMYFSADLKKLNETEIYYFINAFAESFKILQKKG